MNSVFLGAIPYGLSVNKLTDAFPVPDLKECREITHEELESVIEINRKESIAQGGRYYGVVNSWVAKLKSENGLILAWKPSVGLRVLPPDEVLSHAETRTKQKAKQLARSVKLYAWVDRRRLDETGQKRLDHEMVVAAKMAAAVRDSQKEMAINLAPIRSLPKRIA